MTEIDVRRQLADYIAMCGKDMTAHARAVLSLVKSDSALDHAIRQVLDRHLMSVDVVDLEEDIRSLSMLEEVFACEHIANNERDCVGENQEGSKVLLIRGYIPPAIEIYKETTSFRPASFRPDGYPGTDKWFDRFGRFGS